MAWETEKANMKQKRREKSTTTTITMWMKALGIMRTKRMRKRRSTRFEVRNIGDLTIILSWVFCFRFFFLFSSPIHLLYAFIFVSPTQCTLIAFILVWWGRATVRTNQKKPKTKFNWFLISNREVFVCARKQCAEIVQCTGVSFLMVDDDDDVGVVGSFFVPLRLSSLLLLWMFHQIRFSLSI